MNEQRDYRIIDGLPGIKERNAARRELEAAGFNVDVGGWKGDYLVRGWKGEKPAMLRETFNLRDGTHERTPLYRRADGDGFEYMDGTNQYDS